MTKYIAIFEVEDDCNIKTIDAEVSYTYESNGTYYGMREGIEFAKEKTGKWIDTDNYYQRWKCSECGCHTRDAEPNFCPNCGAKMVEPQESEDTDG